MDAAAAAPPSLRIGVIGAEHPHLFTIVEPLLELGATTVAHSVGSGMWPDAYRGWRTDSDERSPDGVLDDPSIDLIVTADVPSKRGPIAAEALRRSKNVLADKPGVTTIEHLDAVVAASTASSARWWVLFSERFEHPAVIEAVRMARSGELGEIVHVTGLGPHSLGADTRPDWFWDMAATGGILVDLASHQVDQFLAVTGATSGSVSVVAAAAGNAAVPQHPGFEDVGHIVLACDGVVGHHRVDYLTPAGLGAWGDPRLTIVGTRATAEVRAVIDVAGTPGGEHLIVVDAEGTRRVDDLPPARWAVDLLADLFDDGERFMARNHSAAVSRLTLEAQRSATVWKQAATT